MAASFYKVLLVKEKVLPGKVWLVSMSQKAFLSLEST